MARSRAKKIRRADLDPSVRAALSTGSPQARAAFDRPGGLMGPSPRAANKRDRKAAKHAARDLDA